MIPLTVHHRTAYRYRRSVDLWPHRLLLCPRESRDLQVISCVVTVSPTAQVTWAHDVFGNVPPPQCFKARATVSSSIALRSFASRRPRGRSSTSQPPRSSILSLFGGRWTDLGSLNSTATSGSGRTPGDSGAGVRLRRSDRYAGVAQGPQRRRVSGDPLSEPGRRGNPVADRDARPRLGLLPGFRGPLRRSGASSVFRREARLRLPFQPRSDASGIDRRRIDARLGRSLRIWRRVDQLRSDEPQRRRRQSHSRCGRPRHPAGGAGVRRLCWKQRRAREHVGQGPRHVGRSTLEPSDFGAVLARRGGARPSRSLLHLTERCVPPRNERLGL